MKLLAYELLKSRVTCVCCYQSSPFHHLRVSGFPSDESISLRVTKTGLNSFISEIFVQCRLTGWCCVYCRDFEFIATATLSLCWC